MGDRLAPEDQKMSISMSPNQLHEFIEKLATDDDFRARLTRQPRETLAAHGIVLTDDQIPEVIRLPDKAELGAYMETWTPPVAFPFIMFNYIPFAPPRSRGGGGETA